MTQIQHVTGKEMLRRTGVNALGYTYPDKDLILLKKGLTGKTKKNVLAHEVDHLEKGEEGPFLSSLVGAGVSALGGLFGGSKKEGGQSKALAYQNQARAETREDLQPYRDFGTNRLGDYQAWEASPAGKFRFQQPGRGGGGNVFSQTQQQAPSLSSDQIRQNLIGTGQFNKTGGGLFTDDRGQSFFLNQDYGNKQELDTLGGIAQAEWDRYKAQQQARGQGTRLDEFTPNNQEEDYYYIGSGGGGGGLDEAALNQAIQAQLGQQQQAAGYYSDDRGAGADFRTDPAYQFRLSEGQNALENSAAARGGALSGNALRGINEFGQNVASQEYGKIYDREYQRQLQEYQTDYGRKFGDVNLGYGAAAGGAALNQAGAAQAGQAAIGLGNARADTSNNIFSSIAGGIGAYQGQQNFNDLLKAYGNG